MAIEKQINIVVKETGLDQVQKQVNKLDNSLENLSDTNKGVAKSMGESSGAVLENGGAMGLLNDATGGLAMTVKDAVEASWLFTKSQKAASTMTAIQTTVVGTSTGAMKAFRIALAATGVGLLVIGLGLLIANFDKVKKAVLAFIPGLTNVGDFISNIVENITDFIGVTSEAERALADLTAQADKSLAMNKKFVQEQGDILNEYTKAKIDAKNRYLEAIKEDGANQKALAARLNRELLAIDKKHNDDLEKARKEKQDKIDDKNKKAKQDKEKADEDAKKAAEDKAKALDEKRKADAELRHDQLQKEIDDEKERKERSDAIFEAKNEKDAQDGANKLARIAYEYEEEKKLDEKRKADKILAEQTTKDALVLMAESTASIFDNLEALGLKKSKAAQAIRKGIALAQIAVDTGKAIGSAVELAQKAGVAAQTAAPMVPGIGTVATIASYASSAAMIFSNVAKAKQLLSSGGSGGGGSTGGGGGSVPSAPSFNLVQGTNSNQIAQSINTQQPIEAYVVSKNVSTGQELDRNIIKSASL